MHEVIRHIILWKLICEMQNLCGRSVKECDCRCKIYSPEFAVNIMEMVVNIIGFLQYCYLSEFVIVVEVCIDFMCREAE